MTQISDDSTDATPPEDARQRILRVAAQMFAERGFHAVSIRNIAAESKVSVSTVLYHGGSKQQLLERILANSFSAQTPLLHTAARLDPDEIGDHEAFLKLYDWFVELLVQQAVEFPQVRRLWLRLLLDEPTLFLKFDAEYSWPLSQQVIDLLHKLRERGIISGNDDRLRYFVASVDWILDGFFSGGVYEAGGCRSDPTASNEAAKLIAFLKDHGRSFFAG